MIEKTLYTILFIFIGFNAQAQYAANALRFSQTYIGGSARMNGLGGAQTSLGGDISAASGNPAGLGFYNRSEFSISPSLLFGNASSTYLGNSSEIDNTHFGIGNLGIVFNNTKDDIIPGKWRGGSFAISMNRINNFNSKILYRGENGTDDFIDYAIENGNLELDEGIYPNDDNISPISQLFWEAYLIDLFPWFDENGNPITDPNTGDTLDIYDTILNPVSPDDPATQRETITRKGSQLQWNFAYGGNFGDKLYLGAKLGFTTIDFEETREYNEIRPRADQDMISDYTYTEIRDISGAGFFASLGIIYRPINMVTLGLSYTTPTLYSLNERLINEMVANWNNYVYVDGEDPLNTEIPRPFENSFNFRLQTPQRLNGGATVFFGKSGFITADVEWVDYGANKLRDDLNELSPENDVINSAFTSAVNLRVGGEFRYDVARFRAGFAHYGNPYLNNNFDDGTITFITGGAGLRFQKFYTDLSVVYSTSQESFSPYIFGDGTGPVADVDESSVDVMLTIGFTF